MHASRNSGCDGARDGALRPQSLWEASHVLWNPYSRWFRTYSNSLRGRGKTMGRKMGRARNQRPSGASIARPDFEYVALHRYPVSQYGGTHHGTRSRCFWNQHFARAGRYGKSYAETRRLSQTRSNAARRVHLFRPSQRSRTDPHGYGLESREFASRGIGSIQQPSCHSLSSCHDSKPYVYLSRFTRVLRRRGARAGG